MGTIGDDKVVAEVYEREWYDDSVGCNSMRTELALSWKCKHADRPQAGTKLIPQSDYASLLEEKNQVAAERDAAVNGRLVIESKLHFATYRADIAESQVSVLSAQLAELREAFARLALQWSEDALRDQASGILVSHSEAFASAILRTLAAAGGATTGKTK